VKQQVVPFGAARFQHFDRRLLRKSRRRCVDIDDAIDDPPHSEKIINRQENDRRQDESDNGQADSSPAAQGIPRRKDFERLGNFYFHYVSPGLDVEGGTGCEGPLGLWYRVNRADAQEVCIRHAFPTASLRVSRTCTRQ
jgi:hypothetical protein